MIFDRLRRLLGLDSPSGGSSSGGPGGPSGNGDASAEPDPCPSAGGSPGDASRMIPCREALARMYEFLDGELDDVSRDEVEAHFDVCSRCYPQLASELSFRAAVQRAMEGTRAPAHLRDRIQDLLGEPGREG